MRIKDDLMLRQISEDWIIVPMGERLSEFNGIMKINETGAFLWKLLEEGATKEVLVDQLVNEYEIGNEFAREEVRTFLGKLYQIHVLEEG